MKKEPIDISILYKSIDNRLTVAERQEVDEWVVSNAAHKEYYDRMVMESGGELSAASPGRELILSNMLFLRVSMIKKDQEIRKRRRRTLYRTVGAAAILFAVGMLGLVIDKYTPAVQSPLAVGIDNPQNNGKVSCGGISMITSGGEVLAMEDIKSRSQSGQSEYMLTDNDSELSYFSDSHLAAPQIVTLKVGRGSDFRVRLEDGTMVWLNSDTEIEYPSRFDDRKRMVTVRGEAYFEVAKDPLRPFIVSNGFSDIEVLGTQFNVNNRKPWKEVATLVEGSIAVRIPGQNNPTYLKPGQTATLNPQTMKIDIVRDDVGLHIGWKTGIYKFRRARIEDIMNELALWHDLDITYIKEELKDEVFSGSISRNESLQSWLTLLGSTGHISFELDGKNLTIK